MHAIRCFKLFRGRGLPAASRLAPRRPQQPPSSLQSWSSRRITSQAARLRESPYQLDTDVDESVRDTYDEEHVAFYRDELANTPRYSLFDDIELNRQYPCHEDYSEPAPDLGVSCRDIDLPRKARGSILLRIYDSLYTTSRSPVIIYFPSRGTNPLPLTYEHHVISLLTMLTNSTIISVGYRVSPPFPLSLHDAVAAMDWARSNVPTVSLEEYCENNYNGRLMAVLGTGIGGSLAASIGATDGRESGIIATGSWLPIVDWAFDPLPGIPESDLSTIPRSQSALEKYSQSEVEAIDPDLLSTYSQLADNPFLSSETLKTIRSHYLATPEDFTDPFVSPLYRFSSSGVNIWTNLISRVEAELLADPENPPAWIKALPDTVFKRGPRNPVSYPPLNLIGKLTVPMMRIVSAEGDILHRQITEYVHAARSSMFPAKSKTIEDIEREETLELGKTHNNDIFEELESLANESKTGVGWNIMSDESDEGEDGCVKAEGVGQNDIGVLESAEVEATGKPVVGEVKSEEVAEPEPEEQKILSQDDTAELEETSRDLDVLKYAKGAEIYIQHEVIPKSGHCLITAADKISGGMKEVERMAAWINSVFESEPKRAQHWKAQQEQMKKAMEEAMAARRKRATKL
ncbi:hypothetical protein TWF718_010004 [Orbilia javanica]|uniref:Alpha/beta hydrolase fold-3 domain-containing protein n=1 Tax=Orbilia javanica TaxID=47235 RepID=A0AAN8MUI6_9PEZI